MTVSLQSLVSKCETLTDLQKSRLIALLGARLHAKKYASLASKINNVPLSCWSAKASPFWDRITWDETAECWRYTPFQFEPAEIREARNAIMGWKR